MSNTILIVFVLLMQGLFMYWLTSSLFTMGQISLLKFPSFRSRMGIPELIKHPQQDKAKKDGQGFLAMVKSSKSASISGKLVLVHVRQTYIHGLLNKG